MALNANVLNSLLQANISASLAPYNSGVVGPQFINFTTALATGIVGGIVGSTFNTVDSGSVANPGAGAGIGVTGLNSTTLSTLIYNNCTALFGSAGLRLRNITDGIAQGLVQHIAAATLTSTHTPVYSGSGIVSFTASTMSSTNMSNLIATASTFTGVQWLNFCTGVSTAIVSHIKSVGTGLVTITGAAPPSPIPGTGVGTGTIT